MKPTSSTDQKNKEQALRDPEICRLKFRILLFLPTTILTVILLAKLISHLKHKSNCPDESQRQVNHNIRPKDNPSYYFPRRKRKTQKFEFPFANSYVTYGSFKSALKNTKDKREILISALPLDSYLRRPNDSQQGLSKDRKILHWRIPINDTINRVMVHRNPTRDGGIEINLITNLQNDPLGQSLFRRSGGRSRQKVRQVQAGIMKRYMDESVNPCQDFYKHACGNWERYNPIPSDKIGYDTFEVLRERLDVVLKNLLAEEADDESFNSNDPIIKAKHFYKSCTNEDMLGRRSEKPLLKLLGELGGWPVVEPGWDESQFDWMWLLAQLRLYNNDVLISEWVGPDIKNANEYVVQFDQTTLGLPSKQYFLEEANAKYLEAYRVYMITIATLLGAPIVNATQDAEEMISFEIELALIIEAPDQRKNISDEYTRITLGELHSIVPQIEWLRYLNIVMDTKVQATERVVCFSTEYFQDLVALLSQTPQRTIANYLLWRFVRNRVNNLDKRFQDAKQRFYYILFGREKSPPRWQTCVTQVNSNMGMALGSLFVQQYFGEASKNDTLQMTTEIQQAFRELLSDSTWLDEDTKILARVKIDAMRLRIGYPDFILDVKELTKRYVDVKIHPDFYFENTLSILQHLTRTEHLRLGTVVDKLMWSAPPAVVNAYYSRNKNQIMFPAGILQPPFYQKHFPHALNYGGIGVVIGHEITHGFDDKGRLFDKEGNLHRWWRDSAVEAFHQRAQCLIDQYNQYVVPDVNLQIDGVSTQGENIADNGGLKEAYNAYMKWMEKHPEVDETLPGLNLSNKQMFFLNFAQVWCGTSRVEGMENKLRGDVHAPGRYRVIGSISNSEEFSKAYNCPLGSPMNPVKKCSIW